MIDALRPILARVAGPCGTIEAETRLQEGLGIGSLGMIDLAIAVEDEFRVRVPDEAAERFRTVGDIVAFLEQTGPR